MTEKKLNTSSSSVESSKNIFDEFSTDSSLINEVEKLKEEQKKDLFYYLSLVSKIFQKVFILALVLFIFSYWYLYIQKNENFSNSAIIDSICFLFMDPSIERPEWSPYCSSVSYVKNYYKTKLTSEKLEQSKKILENLVKIYEQENFSKTKEMSFLIDKSKETLSTLSVLERFNSLKNEFSWIDKSRVQCSKLEIDFDKKTLAMKCSSFSQWYERWIIWFSWKKNYDEIWGTSISIANSFLNYIEKNSTDFTLIDRQKIFSSESVIWESNWYTNKTLFDIILKINF